MFGRFRYKPRPTRLPLPPATITINNIPRRGKGPSLRLVPELIRWISSPAINTAKGVRNVLGKSRGWVNKVGVAESVGFAGNIFGIEYIEGDFARLMTLLPDDAALPTFRDPLFVHMLTAVSIFGRPRLFADGVQAWHPFIFSGPAWAWLGDIEVFSAMPQPLLPGGPPAELAGYPAEVRPRGTTVRQKPEGVKVYTLDAGEIVRVISERGQWAKIGERQWVELAEIRAI